MKDDINKLQTLENKDSIDVLIIRNCAQNVMQSISPFYKNLNWVMAIGTGVEALLKCDHLRQSTETTITNLKSVSSVLLAEFSALAILYFYKRVSLFQEAFANKMGFNQRIVRSVSDLKVLIVGIGSIGQEVALKCKHGFGMKIYGVKRDLANTEHLEGLVDGLFRLDQLAECVSDFDVVVSAMPIVSDQKIFTRDVFANMKKGSVFVNIGRGSYVDEDALREHLLNDHLLGAGLDVLDNEPIKSDNPFYDERLKQKLFYSYHHMDASVDTDKILEDMVIENIENYVSGRELTRVIDKELGY